MKRRTPIVALSLILISLSALGQRGGGGSHGGSSSHSGGASVYVHGYTRADGTAVRSYVRSAPGSRGTTTGGTSNAGGTTASNGMVDATVERSHIKRIVKSVVVAPLTPGPNSLRLVVLVDPLTMRYYREGCEHPSGTKSMVKSSAIREGYRPAPECYAR